EFLTFLCKHRWLFEIFMTGGTAFTLALELGFPFLVWNRKLRPVMLICAVLFHIGIAAFMGLTGFGLMMLTLLLAFVPSDAVQRWIEALADTFRPLLKNVGRGTATPGKRLVESAKA